MKKILAFFAAILLLVSSTVNVFCTAPDTEQAKTTKVSLRVEGIKENLAFLMLEVPHDGDELLMLDLLEYANQQAEELAIVGLGESNLASVGGEEKASFGGWDGWNFLLNGKDISNEFATRKLAENDEVVLYYGDPYGVGIQYPVFAEENGIFTITDQNTGEPVFGAVATIYSGDKVAKYRTNDNGKFKIDKDKLEDGEYFLQVEKYAESGLPLVLRLAPEHPAFTLATTTEQTDSENVSSSAAENLPALENSAQSEQNPSTGVKSTAGAFAVMIISMVTAGLAIIAPKNHRNKSN